MKESLAERALVDAVKSVGGVAYKFISPGNAGVPDRLVIFPGMQPAFVEMKTESGKLSALQQVQIKRLEDLKQDVYVLHGIKDVAAFMREYEFNEAAAKIEKRFLRDG